MFAYAPGVPLIRYSLNLLHKGAWVTDRLHWDILRCLLYCVIYLHSILLQHFQVSRLQFSKFHFFVFQHLTYLFVLSSHLQHLGGIIFIEADPLSLPGESSHLPCLSKYQFFGCETLKVDYYQSWLSVSRWWFAKCSVCVFNLKGMCPRVE